MHPPLARLSLPRRPSGARLCAGSAADLSRALLERVRAEAREEGRRRAEGEAAGALEQALAALEQRRAEAEGELARQAVELALEIAEALLQRAVDAGAYDLERIVREALAASGVSRGERVVIHLAPADHARLAETRFRAGTELVPDPDIPLGDVHLATPHGVLVRDLEHALRAIAERLRGEAP
jgi:flagellar biosynthesis/type III secretory pathway protein FliH